MPHLGTPKFTYPNFLAERVEQEFSEPLNTDYVRIEDIRESDTGSFSCNSTENPAQSDSIHVFVHKSKIFLPSKSVFSKKDLWNELTVPCKTTKLTESKEIELYADGKLVASQDFDPRHGFRITRKGYAAQPSFFECKFNKKNKTQSVDFIISKNEPIDNEYILFWEDSFPFPHVGYNFSLTCHLVYIEPNGNAPKLGELAFECPQCQSRLDVS